LREWVDRGSAELYWEYAGADVERAHEIYHDDAVVELPQSGERFEGVDNFTEWRVGIPPTRVTGSDGSRPETTRGGARADNVKEGWEAPEWRARWRVKTPADPPEATG
jgi:hypothetical protein